MEENGKLIEDIIVQSKNKGSRISVLFWFDYLKKSWPVYVITVIFTIVFVVIYLLSGNPYQLFESIFYPVIMLLFLIGEGVFKNIKYLKKVENDLKTMQISIYSTHIKLTNHINGIQHSSEFPYSILKKIYYKNATEEFIFVISDENSFTIKKEDISEETFTFLTTLFTKKMEKEG